MEDILNEYTTGQTVEQVTDEKAGVLEGTGTDDDPYVINSIEDLVVFASNVREGTTYEGKTVKLGLNLDFNSNKSYVEPLRTDYEEYGYDGELKTLLTSEEGFKAIGSTQEKSFYGTFDGNYHKIYNLYIGVLEYDRIGLFRYCYGTIRNLGLENIKYITNTVVENVVHGGGITGQITSTGNVENCYVTGNIVTSISSIGGITGYTTGNIKNCYSNVNITNNVQTEQVSGMELKMGGIAATLSGTGSIINSYNLGNLNCKSKLMNTKLGGILGESNSTNTISNCYNLGDILYNGESVERAYVGGIVGHIKNATITNCCNNSNINATCNNTLAVGAILGNNNNNGLVDGCYYISNIEQGIGQGGNDTAIKVDDENNMPDLLLILGNGFKKDTNNINNGYPILNWE